MGQKEWAEIILIATPIRWGSASSLYYKMVERMNCGQSQVTIANRVLLKNKVAAFIIIGGQDNFQGVAGQMLGFFAEVGAFSRSSPTLPTHGAGPPRTWSAMWLNSRRAPSCARERGLWWIGRRRWPRLCCTLT
jgi:NADPH-dependent FMN reductase